MTLKSTPYYQPEDQLLLPPKNADILTTCCDYCIVACGYKVYRWPANQLSGGPEKKDNALDRDYPLAPGQGGWIGPNQITQATHDGQLHNIAIVADPDATVVNVGGDHSIRGGCSAQKVYNPKKTTHDRLQYPLVRINDTLMPVSWDFALDIMAEVSKHTIQNHGEQAWALKYANYQYVENSYALTKLSLRSINTPAVAPHNQPAMVNPVQGWQDVGYDPFGASYKDFATADCLVISGTDPFETKTVLWNSWIVPGITKKTTKVVFINPRKSTGVAYAEKMGGIHLDIHPGSDTAVHMALQRIIMEKGWEDKSFIEAHTNNAWESASGTGRGTGDTPSQWRTGGKMFKVRGYQAPKALKGTREALDYFKDWVLAQEESKPEVAAKMAGIDPAKLYQAAEMMAKPNAAGERPKTSVLIEKGNYGSNNYLNSVSIATLGVLLGAGGRPGRVMARLGGHQRGSVNGGTYPITKSPYKMPGGRRHRLDLDRWMADGQVRFAYVVGTTWIQASPAASALEDTFKRQVKHNPHQVRSLDKQTIIDTLKKRVDSGGTVVVNQDIYRVDPLGSQYADIVLPAATWGEADFVRANGERRLRLYAKFYDAPGQAQPDWKIVSMFAKKMGFAGYDWQDANEVFEETCRFTRGSRNDYSVVRTIARRKGVKAHDFLRSFGTQGLQTPLFLDGDLIVETARLHDQWRKDIPTTGPQGVSVFDKRLLAFSTPTGKLNFLKSPWKIWADFHAYMTPKDEELWVVNGRINEVWQSGFDDTQRRPLITQRWPWNFLEMHPDDAKKRGIESGDFVTIASDRVPVQEDFNLGVKADAMRFSSLMQHNHIKIVSGQFTAVAIVTPQIKKGSVYTNCLVKNQPANTITPRVPDPLTLNYRFKVASATVKKAGVSPFKETFSQMSLKRRDIV